LQASLDALGIPPWRRTLGDEPAKTLAILSHEPVKHVDERRQSERAKDASEGSGELDLGKEHEAPTSVARDWGTIAEYEPPAFAAPFLRHRSEQAPGLLIGERKQCQFFASVERGDDPRRPTAEPSAAGIEQDRARQVRGGRYARAHVLRPVRRKTMPRTCLWLKHDESLRHHIIVRAWTYAETFIDLSLGRVCLPRI
jgi:hypothetical protein